VAERLKKGEDIRRIRDVRGTALVMKKGEWEEIAPLIASGVLSQRAAARRLEVGRATIQRRLREAECF